MFNKEDIKTTRLTASGILSDKPCWLFAIVGNSYATTSSLIRIYDGRSTSGKNIMDLSGSQYGSDIVVLNSPIFFKDGIYAEFATAGYSVFCQFLPTY